MEVQLAGELLIRGRGGVRWSVRPRRQTPQRKKMGELAGIALKCRQKDFI